MFKRAIVNLLTCKVPLKKFHLHLAAHSSRQIHLLIQKTRSRPNLAQTTVVKSHPNYQTSRMLAWTIQLTLSVQTIHCRCTWTNLNKLQPSPPIKCSNLYSRSVAPIKVKTRWLLPRLQTSYSSQKTAEWPPTFSNRRQKPWTSQTLKQLRKMGRCCSQPTARTSWSSSTHKHLLNCNTRRTTSIICSSLSSNTRWSSSRWTIKSSLWCSRTSRWRTMLSSRRLLSIRLSNARRHFRTSFSLRKLTRRWS